MTTPTVTRPTNVSEDVIDVLAAAGFLPADDNDAVPAWARDRMFAVRIDGRMMTTVVCDGDDVHVSWMTLNGICDSSVRVNVSSQTGLRALAAVAAVTA